MKRLSEFKDAEAIRVVAKLIPPVMAIVTNKENAKAADKAPFEMFAAFFENSAEQMVKVFAILSEVDPAEYHCDGVEAAQNIMTLASDEKLTELFISQGQTGDATSSGSASENTEAQ